MTQATLITIDIIICNNLYCYFLFLEYDDASNNETRIKDQSNESYLCQMSCVPPSFTEKIHNVKINCYKDEKTVGKLYF